MGQGCCWGRSGVVVSQLSDIHYFKIHTLCSVRLIQHGNLIWSQFVKACYETENGFMSSAGDTFFCEEQREKNGAILWAHFLLCKWFHKGRLWFELHGPRDPAQCWVVGRRVPPHLPRLPCSWQLPAEGETRRGRHKSYVLYKKKYYPCQGKVGCPKMNDNRLIKNNSRLNDK